MINKLIFFLAIFKRRRKLMALGKLGKNFWKLKHLKNKK